MRKRICRQGRRDSQFKEYSNRESGTIVTAISAATDIVTPLIVFKGKEQLAGWQKTKKEKEYWYCVQENGYMDSRLTLDYLGLVFRPETAPIAPGRWRLLVLDRFDCHLDYRVIEYCWQHCILPFALPPHMSHVLQPLDVAVFSSLSNAYGKEVNYIRAAVDKDMFPNIFSHAQQAAFTPSNIRSGFRKTGIWPFDPPQRLQNIRQPQLLSHTPSDSPPSSPRLSFTHTPPPPPNSPSSDLFYSPKTPTTP